MKWIVRTLIILVITASLFWGFYMKNKNDHLGHKAVAPIKAYEGTINGKYDFQMVLRKEGNRLTGTLTNTFNNENEVKGTIDTENAFIVDEFDKGQKVGVLEGRIIPGGNIKGTWSTPDGRKWFPFYLFKTEEKKQSAP